jgi:hypothetical protein
MYFRAFFIIFIMIFTCSARAQLDWYISPEAGVNKNQNDTSRGLSTLEAFVSYDASLLDGELSASGQFRWEFYGLSDPDRIERYTFLTSYSRQIAGLKWQLLLNFQNHTFKQVNTDAFNIFFCRLSCDIPLTVSSSLNSMLSAGNSILRDEENTDGTVLMAEIKYLTSLSSNLSFGGGIYSENYGLTNSDIESNTSYKIWKTGPVVSLDYLKFYIVRLQYRYIFYTNRTGNEHYLRFVAGRIIQNRWPVFFLADYYFRSAQTPFPVTLNLENRVYVKAGYAVSEQLEIYFKSGYFRDEFDNTRKTFTRWNFLIGLEIRS